MLRPDPPDADTFRERTSRIAEQLAVLEDRWLQGTPPSPDDLDAIAEDLGRLRTGIVPGGYLAPWDPPPRTRPRPTRAR